MKKMTWLFFCAFNLLGSVFASYGTVYSESAFVRWSWLAGFILLLPGYFAGLAVSQVHWLWMLPIKSGYIFLPVTIATNALVWVAIASAWRRFRRKSKN
jgi:hypothetical protein